MQMANADARRWIDAGLLALGVASLAVALAPLGWPFELFAFHSTALYDVALRKPA